MDLPKQGLLLKDTHFVPSEDSAMQSNNPAKFSNAIKACGIIFKIFFTKYLRISTISLASVVL